MSAKQGDKPKVVSSFKIDPDLLKDAKELAYQLRISYSGKVESFIREWVEKEHKKKKP